MIEEVALQEPALMEVRGAAPLHQHSADHTNPLHLKCGGNESLEEMSLIPELLRLTAQTHSCSSQVDVNRQPQPIKLQRPS